jgi:hypothetical protein
MVTMDSFYIYTLFLINYVNMIDSDVVLSKKEKEELVLDLYFEQNKTYSEIAKIARMSPRDIKTYYRQGIPRKGRKRA